VRRYQPVIEALAVLALTFALAAWLHVREVWFVVPAILITATRRSAETYGLSLERPGTIGMHLTVIVVVFVPYVLLHYAWEHWRSGATFHLRFPPAFLPEVFNQILSVALPEEFFFRGYLQTQCDRVWGKPYRFLGAQWGGGLPVTAALFAACHVVYGGPVRLVVFFPGLLYGWLRARTETIAVPVLYHAGSNLLMSIMLASLSP
jgi:membrane protease YdiL (CAAX protease family)